MISEFTKPGALRDLELGLHAKLTGNKQAQDKITVNPPIETTHLCLGHKSARVNLIFDQVHSKKLWRYKESPQSLGERVVRAVGLLSRSLLMYQTGKVGKGRWDKSYAHQHYAFSFRGE